MNVENFKGLSHLFKLVEEINAKHESADDKIFAWYEIIEENNLEPLGSFQGFVYGAVTTSLENEDYMNKEPLSGCWHLLLMAYDDNDYNWYLTHLGHLSSADKKLSSAAHELLSAHAEPGDDPESREDCADMIEKWRCRALGLPEKESRLDRLGDDFIASMPDDFDV